MVSCGYWTWWMLSKSSASTPWLLVDGVGSHRCESKNCTFLTQFAVMGPFAVNFSSSIPLWCPVTPIWTYNQMLHHIPTYSDLGDQGPHTSCYSQSHCQRASKHLSSARANLSTKLLKTVGGINTWHGCCFRLLPSCNLAMKNYLQLVSQGLPIWWCSILA